MARQGNRQEDLVRFMAHHIRPITDVLQDGDWSSYLAILVGGGPSLKTFDFSQLVHPNVKVVAINKAYLCGVAHMVVGSDREFWLQSMDDPNLQSHPLKVLTTSDGWWQWPYTVYRADTNKVSHWSTSLSTGVAPGRDTGIRALNLVDNLRPRRIGLLGFDMSGGDDGKQAWWHSGYTHKRQPNVIYERFLEGYQHVVTAGYLKSKVFNLSPTSKLNVFPFMQLEEFLRDA